MEFGYEKAEEVHFIPSSEIAKNQERIEQHLNELNAAGLSIGIPNWEEWGRLPSPQAATPHADTANEKEEDTNPFGGDSDEEDLPGSPFDERRLSGISIISRRSSRANSLGSQAALSNPFD